MEDQRRTNNKLSFIDWLNREYYDKRELMWHPSWHLALEIHAKWPEFPKEGGYLELALFLANHGACTRCKKAFRDAYENYIGDIGQQ